MADNKKTRREFVREGVTAVAAMGLLWGCTSPPSGLHDAGPDGHGPDAAPPDAGADLTVPPDARADQAPDTLPAERPTTTVRERVVSVLPLETQPESTKSEWGVTTLGPGEPHLRQDLLLVDAVAGTPTGAPASLFFAAHFTDTHLIDEESPARALNLDQVLDAAWRRQEAHATQVLDAMVRKLHKFHALRQLDCVLFTGDSIDNNQSNELGWFLEVLEGKSVVPNSGAPEDPKSGPDNDPHDSFVAAGMGSIPWYVAIGNHDALIQGNLPHNPVLGYSLVTGDPTRDTIGNIDLGRVNDPACNPIPADESPLPDRCIPTHFTELQIGSLAPDQQRYHLSKTMWIEKVLYAAGSPAGHGLTSTCLNSGEGDYVADPVPGLPLRLVVLDTTAPASAVGLYGRIDSFLKPALQQAQADEVLVIVVSHHYLDNMVTVSGKLRQTLNSFPNVIMHLVGHGHHNTVTARPGASPAHGYWEVQTCSLIEWPQQGRLVELVDNRDGTAEIWLTMFDYDTDHQPTGALVEGSRFLALYEVHAGDGDGKKNEGDASDRNVVLPVVVPDPVQKRLAALPGRGIESKLF